MGGDRDVPTYFTPVVVDYGDLVQMTAVVHPLLDTAARQDLSFSSPGGGGVGGVHAAQDSSPLTPTGAGATTGAGGAGAGGAAGGTGGGSGGGSGGSLPFTGFVPGVVATIGAGFTAAGYTIRRALRQRRR